MVQAITTWTLAVQANRGLKSLAEEEENARQWADRERERLRPLSEALQTYRTHLTSWKKYKAAHEAAWIFGSPGQRWPIRDFQKMTPDKRRALEDKAKRWLARLEERAEASIQRGEMQLPRIREERARLQTYTQPGVTITESPAVQKFEVDLTDWKYGEHLKQKVMEHATSFAQGFSPSSMTPEQAKFINRALERAREYWSHVKVVLAEKAVRQEAGHWQDASRTLRIVMPTGAAPYQLRRLREIINHELRHFSQGFLTYAVGYYQERYLERKPSPGLPSRHIMTPEITQGGPAPQTLREQFEAELDAQGVEPRIKRLLLRKMDIDLHALDDVEFYTRLADAAGRFADALEESPGLTAQQQRELLKIFVGASPDPLAVSGQWDYPLIQSYGGSEVLRRFQPDKFFTTLLRFARGKWKKAVGELVSLAL